MCKEETNYRLKDRPDGSSAIQRNIHLSIASFHGRHNTNCPSKVNTNVTTQVPHTYTHPGRCHVQKTIPRRPFTSSVILPMLQVPIRQRRVRHQSLHYHQCIRSKLHVRIQHVPEQLRQCSTNTRQIHAHTKALTFTSSSSHSPTTKARTRHTNHHHRHSFRNRKSLHIRHCHNAKASRRHAQPSQRMLPRQQVPTKTNRHLHGRSCPIIHRPRATKGRNPS